MSHIDDEQSLKRKLDEYGGGDVDDWFAEIFSGNWRKDESYASVNSYIKSLDSMCFHFETRVSSDAFSPQCSRPITKVQFFVRLISEGSAIFFMEDFDSTVESVHRRIAILTGIPVSEQRLIYHGKQLESNQTLGECGIEKDATLHLVGRMRSTDHPQSWQVIDGMILLICRMCKDGGLTKSGSEYTLRGPPVVSERIPLRNAVRLQLSKFVTMTTETTCVGMAAGHLKVFLSGSVPVAIVLLYASPDHSNKMFGEELIRMFITAVNGYPDSLQPYCVPILFEFCNLLRRKSIYDPMYKLCRYTLGTLVRYLGWDNSIDISSRESMEYFITFKEIFDFVIELAFGLAFELETMVDINNRLGKPLLTDLNDFIAFLLPLKDVIRVHVILKGPLTLRFDEVECNVPYYSREIKFLYCIFRDLLDKMYTCLGIVEEWMVRKEKEEVEMLHFGWYRYLDLLKELYTISELYDGGKDEFWSMLRRRKDSINFLVTRYVERYDNHFWILEHKEATKFECRRHLVMLLLPEVKEDYEDLLEMLIDRSQLLTESFEYIAYAETETLQAGLSLEFKNEEATGPGVLREWFYLVCQELFNPQNALFVACPNDRRRFFPNPASKVHPLHLEYFNFSGRVIALALMHKVQVGIVFDRIFFLQLEGVKVCLDDIRDADPFLYSSCKKILEMDPEAVDQDALGLTFVREVNELGSVEVVELCPGGKKLSVNSKNRREYVDLLIQHNFVISISEQVTHFAEGFTDMMECRKEPELFFHGLELKDLDWMLYGHESTISVEDWKAHTEYNGYNEDDQQITWFWKCVGEMSTEQRKVLLFFWTSVKYLPIEGFSGLASGLYIYKATESFDHLPSSHTCFYRLCFPAYPSLEILKQRLSVITQEHVGSGFGTW